MKKTWKPTVAAALEILASVPYLAGSVTFFIIPTFFTDENGVTFRMWGPVGLILWLPFAVPLLAGGVSAIIRRAWGLSIIGAIVPLIMTILLTPWGYPGIETVFVFSSLPPYVRLALVNSIYVLMAVAVLLLLMSRREFAGRLSVAEYLYSPPKWWRPTVDQ